LPAGYPGAGDADALVVLVRNCAMWAWYEKAVQFFRDVRSELRKVTFPTRRETIASTAVVLIAVFVIALYLGVVDFALSVAIGSILR
jgi:preprotein translocase subunit SecE